MRAPTTSLLVMVECPLNLFITKRVGAASRRPRATESRPYMEVLIIMCASGACVCKGSEFSRLLLIY